MKNKEDFLQEILNIATVNETFFMREINELKWLVDYIQKSDKQLKILSMPSSSGEEVYSILLLMLQKNLDLNRVEIKGYDIDSDAIKKAKEGVFDEHSVHKLDTEVKNRYFTPYGEEHYKIAQNIKNHTFFQQKNIFDLPNEHFKYDVVLSRNMFIYFDDEKRNKALEIIVDLLNPDGIYIKGHADYIKENDQLENIAYGIYKKTSF
jgi:chemotaxis protein methyltransferase CheR